MWEGTEMIMLLLFAGYGFALVMFFVWRNFLGRARTALWALDARNAQNREGPTPRGEQDYQLYHGILISMREMSRLRDLEQSAEISPAPAMPLATQQGMISALSAEMTEDVHFNSLSYQVAKRSYLIARISMWLMILSILITTILWLIQMFLLQ